MLLASFPYIFGYGIAPHGYKFIGCTYNPDDVCVYLSWMRQAADGHFFLRNLFTTEHQNGNGFNLLFLFMGNFARITHLPLMAVFHLFRIISGIGLLLAVYGMAGIWFRDERSRRIALLVVALSSGLGWVLPPDLRVNLSVDSWQPESITFLSIYLSPLYTFPTLLMLGVIYFLYRFSETRTWKYAVYAGLILMLLANIHTYDVITLAIIWSLYSLYSLIRRPRDVYPIYGGLVAVLVAIPMVAYQLHFYLTEPVFRIRATVPTLSPHLKWYAMGYGPLILLAAFGVWRAIRQRLNIGLLLCWVAAGLIAIELPLRFQRKLIMGTHIPLALIAAMGLVGLTSRLKPRAATVVIALVMAFMFFGNLDFMMRDVMYVQENRSQTIAHVPFISDQELGAFEYLRTHAGPKDIILATPATTVLIPGYTGHTVYCGHWGETVKFMPKLKELVRFYLPGSPNDQRLAFLKARGITYVVDYHNTGNAKTDVEDFREKLVPFLKPVFETDEISVYKVQLPSAQ